MKLFLRNLSAVVTLQPARFVEPHPATLRRYVVASVLAAGWLSLLLQPEKLILFYALGMAAIWLRPAVLARAFGSTGPWCAAFALAWCSTTAAALSTMAGSRIVDALLCGYVIVGVGLQTRRAGTDVAAGERESLRALRSALSVEGVRGYALSRFGTVLLLEVGPPIARWQDREIPAYIVDSMERRWVFSATIPGFEAEGLNEWQLLLPPGAVYELP